MGIVETSGYLQGTERALYGTLYLPDPSAESAGRALVLAEPFGEEKKCAYRLLVRLARACAAAGWPVLRVDVSGTGESGGLHEEATLEAWREDMGAAVRTVLNLPGVTGWCALGARFGSLLAAESAVEHEANALILLEPLLSGDDFLNDLERRQKIKDMMGGNRDAESAGECWQRGETADFGGFAVGSAFAEQVRELRLVEALGKLPEDTSLHIRRVSGSTKLPPAWKPLEKAAISSAGGSFEIVRDKPFWGQLEYYESDTVIDSVLQILVGLATTHADSAEHPAAMESAFASEACVMPEVLESPVSLEVEGAMVAGILSRPRESVSGSVGVVFVHGWSGNRSGPHGILTEFARRCATDGVPSLRFDFRGRGESAGEGLESTLPSMADDLLAAASLFAETAGVRRIVYVGMCSGGNVAIGSLKRLPLAEGLFLLSVYPFSDGDAFARDVHRTRHYASVYLRKALHGDTWRRLFQGDVSVRGVMNVLFGHFLKRGGNKRKEGEAQETAPASKTASPVAAESRKQESEAPKKHLANLRPNLPGVMVYGDVDPDAKAARAYYGSYVEEKALPIEFREIEGANHNFSSVSWKKTLGDWLVQFCTRIAEEQ